MSPLNSLQGRRSRPPAARGRRPRDRLLHRRLFGCGSGWSSGVGVRVVASVVLCSSVAFSGCLLRRERCVVLRPCSAVAAGGRPRAATKNGNTGAHGAHGARSGWSGAGACPNLLQRRPGPGPTARGSAEYQRFFSRAPARWGPLQQIRTNRAAADPREGRRGPPGGAHGPAGGPLRAGRRSRGPPPRGRTRLRAEAPRRDAERGRTAEPTPPRGGGHHVDQGGARGGDDSPRDGGRRGPRRRPRPGTPPTTRRERLTTPHGGRPTASLPRKSNQTPASPARPPGPAELRGRAGARAMPPVECAPVP